MWGLGGNRPTPAASASRLAAPPAARVGICLQTVPGGSVRCYWEWFVQPAPPTIDSDAIRAIVWMDRLMGPFVTIVE